MSGGLTSTFERDMNEQIIEYLNYCHYSKTVNTFLSELEDTGKPVKKEFILEESDNINAKEKLLDYFHKGQKTDFFQLWQTVLSEKLRHEDSVCQKLEFYCQIYFAIFPIKNNVNDLGIEAISMQDFREFLETKGAKLSKSTEFVRFYALPYVPNPREHPSFSELFQDNWVPGLEMRLKRFFELVLSNKSEPKLVKLYSRNSSVDDNNLSLKQLQAKVVESERRTHHFMRRLNQVQVDYHSLIGISAELVDLLEGSLQGVPVSPSHLQQVCQRLLMSQQHRLRSTIGGINQDKNGIAVTSFDLSRPGTASMMLRQSLQQPPNISTNSSVDKSNNKLNKLPLKPKPLNFVKIKEGIENGDDRLRSFLLQALRWRLTKTDLETRDFVIVGLSENDLFGIKTGSYHELITNIVNGTSGDEESRQCLARLMNAVSTLSRGRSYMVSNTDICHLLMTNIQSLTHQESILRENLIGALQKLSLRRTIQTYMISNGMIEWLMTLLEENDDLSDYTLDYSVALLMNLCLRSSGKSRCIEHKTRILNVLSKMLNTFNSDITSYVNGALYSILVVPEIREEAKNLNMEETLRSFIKPENPDMNRQIEYIVNQLNSNDEPKFDESDDEEDEDDEEDPEVMEVELDKDEALVAKSGELCGEELLASKYFNSASRKSSKISQHSNNHRSSSKIGTFDEPIGAINRPVTPGTFQSTRKMSMPAPTIGERPPTRSGDSRQSSRSENVKSVSVASPSPGKYQPMADTAEYQNVFADKPKLPRTPFQAPSRQSLSGPRPSSGNPTASNGNKQQRNSIANSTK